MSEGESRVSTYAADVVAILRTDSLAQVLADARPMQATVLEVAELMEHPLEDGSTTADHIVYRPVEIDLPLMLTGDAVSQVFAELRELFRAGTILAVQTRTRLYRSMVLIEIPHDETAEALDAILVGVRFREAVFVEATYGGLAPAKVKDKAKSSTKKKGAQQTTAAAAPKAAKAGELYKGSTLYRLTRPKG